MYYDSFKPIYFTVADTDLQNPPRTFSELEQRCNEIKNYIPAQGDNKIFAEKIFTFFKDCGLITRANVAFLSDKYSCDKFFHCAMNPLGGVLRRSGLPMKTGVTRRYYSSKNRGRAVICEGEIYYISSQWFDTFANQNKAAFYNWVVQKALENLGVSRNLQTRTLLWF